VSDEQSRKGLGALRFKLVLLRDFSSPKKLTLGVYQNGLAANFF